MSNPLIANYFFSTLEQPLQPQTYESAAQADAIVVLSGGLLATETPDGIITEWEDPDRFFAGVGLMQAKKAPLLIFTGGKLPWTPDVIPEGHILKQTAISLGIKPETIKVTQDVNNTFQEAQAVAQMLEKDSSILLVTSAFHMQRAKLIFEKNNFNVVSFAVDFKSQSHIKKTTIMDFLPSSKALNQISVAVREYIGRLYYRIILYELG